MANKREAAALVVLASRKGNAANRSTSRPTPERDAVVLDTVAEDTAAQVTTAGAVPRATTVAIAARGITVQRRMRGTPVVASSALSEVWAALGVARRNADCNSLSSRREGFCVTRDGTKDGRSLRGAGRFFVEMP